MNTSNRWLAMAGTGALVLVAGCGTPPQVTSGDAREAAFAQRAAALSEREATLAAREASLAVERADATASEADTADAAPTAPLLPPDAKPGECYARVWVEPTYRAITEQVVTAPAGERFETVPAVYETVEETVLVAEASSRLETIPAVYRTVTERKLVRDATREWRLALAAGAAPASEALLAEAAGAGIDLAGAQPGQCFHEHYHAARFEQVPEQVLVAEGHELIDTSEAQYRWVEKQVLVREASTRIEEVDAIYETVTEQIVDVPAHTIWKKGAGPIQKIDTATGEIMCLVEVPATYKTITRRVLKSPATTRETEIP
ncbi:MAG: peptidoglycan-binding protein, partial [Gammaproteobacteria bacterium]